MKEVQQLESIFELHSNPLKAPAMSKYMKGLFAFYGISSAERRQLSKQWINEHHQLEFDEFWPLIYELWVRDEREFQYVALDLLSKRKTKHYNEKDVTHLHWLITNKSWWDTVDLIASTYLGKYITLFPAAGNELIEEWSSSEHLWLQRSCLIFQLKYGKRTDVNLLRNLILQLVSNKDFFIQKAIGWSLRQLSKTDKTAVTQILKEIPLKGVALREATKYL